MRLYLILILFSILLNLSCADQPKKKIMPVLVLSSLDTNAFIQIAFDKSKSNNAKFKLLYLGKYNDTIEYKSTFNDKLYDELDLHCFMGMSPGYPDIDRSLKTIEIYVDVTQQIGQYLQPRTADPLLPSADSASISNFERKKIEIRNAVKPIWSYPIFIKNNSEKYKELGYPQIVNFDIEVFRSNQWEVLEKAFLKCGFSIIQLLPCASIGITSIPIFSNLEGTKMRLRLNDCYSNEFVMGKIN